MPFDRLATAALGEPKVGWPAERHAPAHFSDMHTSCQMGLPGLENIYFSVNAFKNDIFVPLQADVARLPSGPTGANRSTPPEHFRSLRWGCARGLTAGRLEQLPSKPNAVRRGVNRQQTRRPAWFARGLTAGRLTCATHSSARNRCDLHP